MLLALLAQCDIDVLDEVVQFYDQALSSTDHRAERKLEEKLAARARASEDRLALLDEMLSVLADPAVPDEAVGHLLRGSIGLERLRSAREAATRRLPRDHGHLEMVEASYAHLREFAPAVMSELAIILLSLFAQMERTYAIERAAHARAVREGNLMWHAHTFGDSRPAGRPQRVAVGLAGTPGCPLEGMSHTRRVPIGTAGFV